MPEESECAAVDRGKQGDAADESATVVKTLSETSREFDQMFTDH